MTLEELKKLIADDEGETVEVKHVPFYDRLALSS